MTIAGGQLVEIVGAEGVNVEHIRRIDMAPSGAAVIHVDERAQKQIFAVPGANHSLTVAHVRDALAAIAEPNVRRSAISAKASALRNVVLAQLEVPLECVDAAFRWARENGAKTVLDPAPGCPAS